MHSMILVIGDNPEERARNTRTPMGTPDWAGIGGRYQQLLIPRPEATTGRVYGDTMPSFEAHVLGLMPAGVDGGRLGPAPGRGVDQIRLIDLDITATIDAGVAPACLLDSSGILHEPGFTPEEEAAMICVKLASHFPDMNIDLSRATTDPEVIESKLDAWDKRVAEILAAADPGELVTAVDVHL